MARIRARVRDNATGAGIASASVEFINDDTSATLSTETADGDGLAIYEANGNPAGQIKWESTNAGVTRAADGASTRQIGGLFELELPYLLRAFGDGYVVDLLDADPVKVIPGTGLQVKVNPGVWLGHGLAYVGYALESLTVTAADPTNPRIDTVVLELDETADDKAFGKFVAKVVAGTPAVSPVAPTLTQVDGGVWQFALADLAVAANAASFTAGNLGDRRTAISLAPTVAPTITGTATFEDVIASGDVTATTTLYGLGNTFLGNAEADIIRLRGQLATDGTDPTVTYGTGAGTGPTTTTLEGDAISVRFVFTTGTGPAAAGANIFTLNFPAARVNTNYGAWIQGVNRQAALDNLYPFDANRTVNGIGFAAEATLAASTEYRVVIWIVGRN